MSKYLILVTLFFSLQTFACIDLYGTSYRICPGDTVYKGRSYANGATVLGINLNKNMATVKSIASGYTVAENIFDLHITKGCLEDFCVDDLIYESFERRVGNEAIEEQKYDEGAKIVGINPYSQAVTVKSKFKDLFGGNTYPGEINNLYKTKGCIYGICVGDKVYNGSKYSEGAIVAGINFHKKKVVVNSILPVGLFSQKLFTEDPKELHVGNLCVDYSDEYRQQSMELP